MLAGVCVVWLIVNGLRWSSVSPDTCWLRWHAATSDCRRDRAATSSPSSHSVAAGGHGLSDHSLSVTANSSSSCKQCSTDWLL